MWYNFIMADEVSKDQQIFPTDQGIKRAILEKTRKAFEEKSLAKIKKRVLRVIKEAKELREKGMPSYLRLYREVYHSDESNIGEEEGWNLFNWRLNPNADSSELTPLERDFQSTLMNNFGFSIENKPPYSIEKEKLSVVKGIARGRKVYYVESPMYQGVYLVRTFAIIGKRSIYRQNLIYAPLVQDLRRMVGLPQAA